MRPPATGALASLLWLLTVTAFLFGLVAEAWDLQDLPFMVSFGAYATGRNQSPLLGEPFTSIAMLEPNDPRRRWMKTPSACHYVLAPQTRVFNINGVC